MTFLGERTPIGCYGSYSEAQRAVDLLSDEGFPVERVTSSAQASVTGAGGGTGHDRPCALAGAGQGIFLGLAFALLLGLFFTVRAAVFAVLICGVVLGAVLGALIGAVGHSAMGGRRDFASVAGMAADRYELMADAEVAEQARRLVSEKLPACRQEST